MYTVDYFINKFSAIPEENWTKGHLTLPTDPTKKCANGHCGVKDVFAPTKEARSLARLLKQLPGLWDRVKKEYDGIEIYCLTANINDGLITGYKQPTPKQRILAALYDIRAMQTRKDATEEILKLPLPVENTLDVVGEEIKRSHAEC